MRNLKKFLALVLAMMMTLSLMVTVNASSFKDDEEINDKYADSINVLDALKVIKGYGKGDPNEGKFLPKNPITRGEVAAILYRIVSGDVSDSNIKLYGGYTEFNDVKADDWFAPYINFCYNNGLIQGVGNKNFAPRSNVTGYETLVMILRAIGYNDPKEFSSDDWRFKASGYGARLELTKNVASGSLGGPATREVVAEIMFKGMQAPMVKYSPLTLYTTDLLVDASEVNASAGATLYAADVPNTLLYQSFKIVGVRHDVVNDLDLLKLDNYGRPSVEWVLDAATDTVQNGGKYIVNPVAGKAIDGTKINNGGSVGSTGTDDVAKGASYIPATTLGASYSGTEKAKITVKMSPVKTYHDVVTECDLTKDVNDDESIDKDDIDEYLNGGLVEDRTNDIDINHTQEGTIGAPGRTTEIYKLPDDTFIFVYIDNFMGVVTNVTKAAYDTNQHVMVQASLTVKVNDSVTVTAYDDEDYDDKVGDLVLMNTYGMKNSGTYATPNAIDLEHLQTIVPAKEDDFKAIGSAATAAYTWAVDRSDDDVTSEEVTVKGTMGTKNHKTGIETDKGDKPGNVVFLASGIDNDGTPIPDVLYYHTATTTAGSEAAFDGDTTVPNTSPYKYGYRMANAAINKTYTIYKDGNGYVVGMTAAEAGTDIGVVTSWEPKRIATGKWAAEVTLYMIDGTEKTVSMLAYSDDGNDPITSVGTPGTEPAKTIYFKNQGDVETKFSGANLAIAENVLVKIQPYTKDGATYYKPIETNAGEWSDYTAAVNADGNNVMTGVADTLTGTGSSNTIYSANPVTWDKANTQVLDPAYNVNDDTRFIIAQVDWDYSLNEGNEGGYNDLERSVYTGFKTIPTIIGKTGDTDDVMFQRIGNNVYVYPEMDSTVNTNLEYTVKSQPTYSVADAYLVYATGTTYQNYSVYKALKNGVETPLNVSNNNLTLVNAKIEAAMTKTGAALVVPTSTNSRGYVTDVKVLNVAGNAAVTDSATGHTQTIAAAATVDFDKHGILHVDDSHLASHPTDATNNTGVNFLTVDKDVKVVIVNLETGKYFAGTQDSVMQYEKYQDPSGGDQSHAFVYELNQYGYISVIYIID